MSAGPPPLVTADPAAFAAAAPSGRLAGLDIGTKTIGIATSTADRAFVSPRETLARRRPAADLAALTARLAAEQVVGVVVGLPVHLDGREGDRARSVRAQARNIAAASGLPVLLWDERWSTAAVTRDMLDADLSRAKRAAAVDRLAAAWILEGACRRLARLEAEGGQG
ncbi:MAG: Holliday junction resolvase RuvX [Thermaurantiacus tibetensis]